MLHSIALKRWRWRCTWRRVLATIVCALARRHEGPTHALRQFLHERAVHVISDAMTLAVFGHSDSNALLLVQQTRHLKHGPVIPQLCAMIQARERRCQPVSEDAVERAPHVRLELQQFADLRNGNHEATHAAAGCDREEASIFVLAEQPSVTDDAARPDGHERTAIPRNFARPDSDEIQIPPVVSTALLGQLRTIYEPEPLSELHQSVELFLAEPFPLWH
mmetsp:Transcript_112995/g.319636  ORF Transcript_112995/g.319636 Transcript_112995/m.319636 type:complete len:220 (+) Transcript_112995:177-836(+)